MTCSNRRPDQYRVGVRGWLDSNSLRIAGYSVAAAGALFVGCRELRRRRVEPDLWPTFWFVTAGLLVVMAIGHLVELGGLASQLGRREAVSEGWYEQRRKLQAIAVASLTALWLVIVLVVSRWVRERRRRYHAMTLIILSLVFFTGVRVVSLHQVDDVLYHREVFGVKIGTAIEVLGLAITITTILWQLRPRSQRERDTTSALVEVS
jgi:drug/metabolite transporter (DMT)-like permease